MEMCVTSKSKNEVSNPESKLKIVKSEEKAQKENADFRQNNNAHLNQMSFIPVYTKKTDMCRYFSDKGDENKSKTAEHRDQAKLINASNSPPSRQRCLADQNEKLSIKSTRTHIRRRSVGFEDMTSLNSCYISNDKRTEAGTINSNISTSSDIACSKILNSDNDINFSYGKRNQRESSHLSMFNQNSRVMKNANNQAQDISRPYQQYKDKSSKRKSSLNRMDFVDFPPTYTGNVQSRKTSNRLKNSSSDEELDTKSKLLNPEFLTGGGSKRKHVISPGAGNGSLKSPQKMLNEVSHQPSSPTIKGKFNPLPKSGQNFYKFRQHHKRPHSVAMQLQKLSYSAGELESLTDETNSTNKVCLSAQEFDLDSAIKIPSLRPLLGSSSKKFPSLLPPVKRTSSPLKNSNQEASQHMSVNVHLNDFRNNASAPAEFTQLADLPSSNPGSLEKLAHRERSSSDVADDMQEPVLSSFNLNDSFELKHIDSKSDDDPEVEESTMKLHNLEISEDKGSDDNSDSDGEKRPNSILRKKYFEERKELHSILKPPPDDKLSKTPPSILKHRESSEEKDLWQQSDLHSILKKSTSEDESCNSGPDIRPILKVSTDEDSPGGSSRPRPILKKRTSFSEECSYASFPNGELKPILKKKTPLSTDDQPRPILKSRRKSEDTRSTLSEFVTSRPRAYSADMGVKPNIESKLEGLEQKMEEFCKRENQQL